MTTSSEHEPDVDGEDAQDDFVRRQDRRQAGEDEEGRQRRGERREDGDGAEDREQARGALGERSPDRRARMLIHAHSLVAFRVVS